jgi:hypothetical protein
VAGQTSDTFPGQTSKGDVNAILAKLAIDDDDKNRNDEGKKHHDDDDAEKKH